MRSPFPCFTLILRTSSTRAGVHKIQKILIECLESKDDLHKSSTILEYLLLQEVERVPGTISIQSDQPASQPYGTVLYTVRQY